MNRYTLRNSRIYFKSSRKRYMLFIMEIFLAAFLLNIFISMSYSSKMNYQNIKNDMRNSYLTIRSYGKKEGVNYISYKDYKHIKDTYSQELDVSYSIKGLVSWGRKDQQGANDIEVLFADDSFFKMKMGDSIEGDTNLEEQAYIGKTAEGILRNNGLDEEVDKQIYEENGIREMKIENDKLNVNGIEINVSSLDEISNSSENIIRHGRFMIDSEVSETDYIDLNNTVIIPIKYCKDMEVGYTKSDYMINSIMLIGFKDGIFKDKIVFEINNYLKKTYDNKFEYRYTSKLLDLEKRLKLERKNMKMLNGILTFCVIIIIIGLNGLMNLNINRRRRGFAIAMTSGASNKQIVNEVLFEVMMIVLPAAVLGSIVSSALIQKITQIVGYKCIVPMYSYFAIILGSVMVTLISSIIPVIRIRKIMPLEVLRKVS